MIATKAINGATKAMIGVWKWLARYDRIEMFCCLAAARSAGLRASTQLKQKNITVSTIMT
ncbi:hypothetical protein D3C79_1026520 [compost metagenome]